MSASEKDLQILKHILEHCNRVTASTERFGKDYDSFSADCDYQDSVNLNLAQIGELAGKLSEGYVLETKDTIPWKSIKSLRNIIVHDYSNVEVKDIWSIVVEDLPVLILFCSNELGNGIAR